MRSALTLIEVMIAISLASFVSAIGFTGVNAFGKAITRSKQFASETQMITMAIRLADQRADNGYSTLPVQASVSRPKNWTYCEMISTGLIFKLQATNKQTGGQVEQALNMASVAGVNQNTLDIKALMIYDNVP
jgi:prepilin-type N-terminal cleavage/methylation domain-containing protein